MIKNGKKPLSSKPKPTALKDDDIFGNALQIDSVLKKELESKGLEPRFVDYKQLNDMGGYHKRGWKAYKRDKKGEDAIVSSQEFHLGSDPDGFVRRGSLILAARPIAIGDRHRTALAQKREAYKAVNKSKARELQKSASEAGVDVQVHEGYEENE